jgi:small subunit ribosomal protein S13
MPEVTVEIKGGPKAKEAVLPAKKESRAAPVKMAGPDVKRIVRIAATDLDGTLPVSSALRKIKGVSFMLTNAICHSTDIDSRKLLGALSEKDVEALQAFLATQAKQPTLPKWITNRRKDPKSGSDQHLVGTDLIFRQHEDINFMKRIRCRRGIRHELGLPVRGQHTRSTGREGRGIGVVRKAAAAAAAPKAAPSAGAAGAAAKPAEKPAEAKK